MTTTPRAGAPGRSSLGDLPTIELAGSTDDYAPGACNIGPDEIARRRRSGRLGLAATVLVAVTAVALGAPPVARLVVFAPAFVAALGYLQARERFCVAFGAAGVANFESVGSSRAIVDADARRADRRRAIRLTARAAAIATAVTLVFALLPA